MTTTLGTNSAAAPAAAAEAEHRLLGWTAVVFTVVVLLHNTDHVRRGADLLTADVFAIGALAMAIETVVVAVVAARHRTAPLLAATAGLGLAFGYVFVHFLPERSWLSDSFISGADIDALSWTAAVAEVGAALLVGAAGLRVLRARGGLASAATPRPDERAWSQIIGHPLVLAMGLGNLVLLALSFAQL